MSPSMTAKASAGRYPVTTNQLTRFPVRRTISPVMRNDMNPSVRKLSGAVMTRANQPTNKFTIANMIPTTIAVQSQSTATPGTIMAAIATAIQETMNSIRSAIREKLEDNSMEFIQIGSRV